MHVDQLVADPGPLDTSGTTSVPNKGTIAKDLNQALMAASYVAHHFVRVTSA